MAEQGKRRWPITLFHWLCLLAGLGIIFNSMGWIVAILILFGLPFLALHMIALIAGMERYERSSRLLMVWSVSFIIFALCRPDYGDTGPSYTGLSTLLYRLGLSETYGVSDDAGYPYIVLGAVLLPIVDILILTGFRLRFSELFTRHRPEEPVRTWWNNRDGSKDS